MSAGRAALAVERLARWVPSPVRRLGRRLLPTRPGGAGIGEWDAPLVGAGDLAWPPRPASEGGSATPGGTRRPPAGTMRCLLVASSLDAGGMDAFVAFLARGLPDHGIEAAALIAPVGAGTAHSRLADELRAAGVLVHDGEADRAAAEAWVRGWRPDVVAVHGNCDWPIEVANELGIPVVLVLHGMHDLFGADEAEVLARYQRAESVVCVSELVRRQYLALSARLDPRRVLTIVNGIDATRSRGVSRGAAREALGLSDEFILLSLSRHALQKNTYGLVSAFADAAPRAPGAHLLVCGREDDVRYAAQVVALRDRHAGKDRVHLRTNAPRPDVLLAAADAFVLDSFFEGWALASMEALAAGVPVILSEVGGAREQVQDGPSRGLLVANPLGDPLAVTWESMGSARFARQVNREQLADAMVAVARREVDFDGPEVIAADAIERFDHRRCLEQHAAELRRAAQTGGS